MTDWSRVPQRAWEWQADGRVCGVHTFEGQLVWWGRPDRPDGYRFETGRAQSFADFLAAGAPVPAPVEVLDELAAILRGGNEN